MGKIFLDGQILGVFRGSPGDVARGYRAVVVSHDKNTDARTHPEAYSLFVCDVGSEDFVNHTGTRAAQYLLDRVYLGLSNRGAEVLAKNADRLRGGKLDLNALDRMVVVGFFLREDELLETKYLHLPKGCT